LDSVAETPDFDPKVVQISYEMLVAEPKTSENYTYVYNMMIYDREWYFVQQRIKVIIEPPAPPIRSLGRVRKTRLSEILSWKVFL